MEISELNFIIAKLKSAITDLEPYIGDADVWKEVPAAKKKELWDLAAEAESTAKTIKDQCKSDLVGGTSITGLCLVESQRASGIDVCAARPTLQKEFGLTDTEILNLCTLPVTKLRSIVFSRRSLDIPGLTDKANAEYVSSVMAPFTTMTTTVTVKAAKKR